MTKLRQFPTFAPFDGCGRLIRPSCKCHPGVIQNVKAVRNIPSTSLHSQLLITDRNFKSSMVLKIYGDWVASAQRVVCVLNEKGVPYELVKIAMEKGEHKSPQYLEKQPFGQLPYIDDDGFILYESRAICHYIASKYPDQGTPLLPTELKANALFHQAASLETTRFDGPAVAAVVERVYNPVFQGIETNEALYDKAIADLSKTLDVYDKILAKQKYLAGDEITLADIYHLPYGVLLGYIGSDVLETRPNVNRWFKELSSRDSWKSVLLQTPDEYKEALYGVKKA